MTIGDSRLRPSSIGTLSLSLVLSLFFLLLLYLFLACVVGYWTWKDISLSRSHALTSRTNSLISPTGSPSKKAVSSLPPTTSDRPP